MLASRTLAFKLSVAFLLLTFLTTLISLRVTTDGIENGILEADQREAIPIVEELSKQIKDHVSPSLNQEAIYSLFNRFSKINPRLTPYLIKENGEILLSTTDKVFLKSLSVQTSPITTLIKSLSPLPILISNPKNINEKLPFAATTLSNSLTLLLVIEPRSLLTSKNSFSSTEKSILIQGFLSFLVAALLGLLLSQVLTRRLRILTEVVKKFKGEALVESIPIYTSKDEVGDLSLAFSKMSLTVSDLIEKLKHRDALRRELIAGVSHDLRTPLAAVKGYVETLQNNKNLTDEKTLEGLKIIERNCNVLQRLIDGLFELTHLEEIVEKIDITPFSLSELLSDIISKFSVQANKKGLILTLTPPSNACEIQGDISLIERAISNIIENAILYTPENGTISASIELKNNDCLIAITDTGRGIKKEDLPNIFEKFFRGDKSREKAVAGTGLGLAITKKIIDAHHGNISVESEVGIGTTFRISLPRLLSS